MKSQLRHADSLKARYAAIIGERELADGTAALNDLREGSQEMVADSGRGGAGQSGRNSTLDGYHGCRDLRTEAAARVRDI